MIAFDYLPLLLSSSLLSVILIFFTKAPSMSTMSQGVSEISNDPLHGISKILHRLETHLAGQDARLQFIETYVRSGAASPVSDGAPAPEDISESVQVNQSSKPYRARHAFQGTPSETGSLAASYRASFFDLQTQFLSSNDINGDEYRPKEYLNSDDESGTKSRAPQLVLPPELANSSRNLNLVYDDAYSVSVYPSEPLARSELFDRSEADLPPVPALPTLPNLERLSTEGIGAPEFSVPYSSTVSAAQSSSQVPPTSPISRSSSLRFWKTRSNRDTATTTRSTPSSTSTSQTWQPHIRAEMTYHAYENSGVLCFSLQRSVPAEKRFTGLKLWLYQQQTTKRSERASGTSNSTVYSRAFAAKLIRSGHR